jgi:P27 family predicted phage terminase small subunit
MRRIDAERGSDSMKRGGRRPKPPKLRLLQGNPGKRAIPAQGPLPPAEIPPRPKFLDAGAREEWDRVAPQLLELGLLSALDRAALAAYCAAWSRWVWAQEKIAAADHLVVRASRGGLKPHPLLALARQESRAMREWAAELGITSSSRARGRLAAAVTSTANDPSERFFRRTPRPSEGADRPSTHEPPPVR